jgi:hypothetical protein
MEVARGTFPAHTATLRANSTEGQYARRGAVVAQKSAIGGRAERLRPGDQIRAQQPGVAPTAVLVRHRRRARARVPVCGLDHRGGSRCREPAERDVAVSLPALPGPALSRGCGAGVVRRAGNSASTRRVVALVFRRAHPQPRCHQERPACDRGSPQRADSAGRLEFVLEAHRSGDGQGPDHLPGRRGSRRPGSGHRGRADRLRHGAHPDAARRDADGRGPAGPARSGAPRLDRDGRELPGRPERHAGGRELRGVNATDDNLDLE